MDPSAPDPDADDLYRRLGLPRTASSADVKKAFRAAAALYHPDQSAAHRDGRAFRRLCEARDVLTDWLGRRDYDRRLTDADAPPAPSSHDPSDLSPRPSPHAPSRDAGHADRPRSGRRPHARPRGSWMARWEPYFPVWRPWVVTTRNVAVVIAVVGNLGFLNAVLATDPDRLREHWTDLLSWNVLVLEALYVSVPFVLQLLSMAMRTTSAPHRAS